MIGDGYYPILTGNGSNPVITLSGPSFATIKDLHVNGNGTVGITGSGLDQQGGRVFSEGLTILGTQTVANIAFNGLASTVAEFHSLL